MPYDARVFQILIASPGDVQEERNILAETIYEWNYVNSRDRRVILLPLRWETHSSPEMGSRAQAVINRQVVDRCDMAVGVFWTRLGTPTGESESGTAEEIARVGNAGKPVMLYFSKSKVDLYSVDLEEYKRLREFKAKTYPQGLIEDYVSPADFRDKFSRQLALKMLDIVAEDSAEQSKGPGSNQLVTISLAQGNPPEILPSSMILELTRVTCSDLNEIPDFVDETEGPTIKSDGLRIGSSTIKNSEYYREIIQYYCRRLSYGPLRLAVTSLTDQGAHDLYLELRISGLIGEIKLAPEPALPVPIPYRVVRDIQVGNSITINDIRDITMVGGVAMSSHRPLMSFELSQQNETDESRIETEIPVVQAQRTVFSANGFWLAVERDSTVIFDATVYSSDSTPFSTQTTVDFRVRHQEMPYAEIVKRFNEEQGR